MAVLVPLFNFTQLLPIERWLILRTIISDEYSVKAGWYWLEPLADEIVDVIAYLATSDPNMDVRCGAISYIQRTDDIIEDIELTLTDSSSKVRQAALKLFEQHGTMEHLELIKPLLNDKEIDGRKSARTATLAILSKNDSHEAISFFRQSPRDERRDFDADLKTVASKAYPAELRLLLNDSDEAVRLIAFREMVSKGELQEHELWQFTKDPYHRIRYEAELVETTETLSDLSYELPADLLDAYHRLLNQKFSYGLTPDEEAELVRLDKQLDEAELATPLAQSTLTKATHEHKQWMRTLDEVITKLRELRESP